MVATPAAPGLTGRQAFVLRLLTDALDRGEPMPSYREIVDALGASGPNAASRHLKELARKGYVRLGDNRARSIRVQRRPGDRPKSAILDDLARHFDPPALETLEALDARLLAEILAALGRAG